MTRVIEEDLARRIVMDNAKTMILHLRNLSEASEGERKGRLRDAAVKLESAVDAIEQALEPA